MSHDLREVAHLPGDVADGRRRALACRAQELGHRRDRRGGEACRRRQEVVEVANRTCRRVGFGGPATRRRLPLEPQPQASERTTREQEPHHVPLYRVDKWVTWGKVGKVVEQNRPQMLLGTYEHTIDDKNRLTLPAKFRESFADGVVVTRGLDRCLQAYRREDWVDSSSLDSPRWIRSARRRGSIQRFLFSGASEAELDKQGRVMIPAPLLEHAQLGRDVVVAGMRDHLEIWDRDAWRRELAEVEGSAEDVAERLAAKHD